MRFSLGLQGRTDYLRITELLPPARMVPGQAACSHSFGGVLKTEPLAEARGASGFGPSAVGVMHERFGPLMAKTPRFWLRA
jgi:hypothetical protein